MVYIYNIDIQIIVKKPPISFNLENIEIIRSNFACLTIQKLIYWIIIPFL